MRIPLPAASSLLLLLGLAIAIFFVATRSPGPDTAEASFHLQRIDSIMGGAFGEPAIQYVELRPSGAGQNFVGGRKLCFFDSAGSPWATFSFPASPPNGATGASILVGSPAFDAVWAAGAPDFIFSAANTVAINPAASVDSPIPANDGKVTFGTDCSGPFVDSLAYGAGYAGTVDNGAKFAASLPEAGTMAIQLTTPGNPRNNSLDYALVDVNGGAGHAPRNNQGQQGQLSQGAPPSPTPTVTPAATVMPSATPVSSATTTVTPIASATPTATPTSEPSGTPAGQQVVWGNNNCSGVPLELPDPVDSLITLRHDAGLNANTGDCPQLGTDLDVLNASPHPWGDVDCSGAIDPIDSLKILRFDAGLGVAQGQGCPLLGAAVSIVEA